MEIYMKRKGRRPSGRAAQPVSGARSEHGITVLRFPQWMMYWLEFLVTKIFLSVGRKNLRHGSQSVLSVRKKFQTKTAFGLIRACLPEHLQNERVKLSDGPRHTHYTVMRFAFLDLLWEPLASQADIIRFQTTTASVHPPHSADPACLYCLIPALLCKAISKWQLFILFINSFWLIYSNLKAYG